MIYKAIIDDGRYVPSKKAAKPQEIISRKYFAEVEELEITTSLTSLLQKQALFV